MNLLVKLKSLVYKRPDADDASLDDSDHAWLALCQEREERIRTQATLDELHSQFERLLAITHGFRERAERAEADLNKAKTESSYWFDSWYGQLMAA